MRFNKTLVTAGAIGLILALSQTIYFLPANQDSQIEEGTFDQNPEVRGAAITSEAISFDRQALYLFINAHRKDNKLGTLRVSPLLELSAQAKIDDMLANNYFRHEDVQNQQSWYLFNNVGYNYKLAGENISFSHNTPWRVFEGWLNSPTHNEQLLLADYEDMGIASDCSSLAEYIGDSCVVVLHLGRK